MAEALCGLELILRGVAERHRAAYVVEPLFVVAIEGSSPGPKPARARLSRSTAQTIIAVSRRAETKKKPRIEMGDAQQSAPPMPKG